MNDRSGAKEFEVEVPSLPPCSFCSSAYSSGSRAQNLKSELVFVVPGSGYGIYIPDIPDIPEMA